MTSDPDGGDPVPSASAAIRPTTRLKAHGSPCTSIRHRISISRDPDPSSDQFSAYELADACYGSQKLMVRVCVHRLIIPIQPSCQPAACS
ncbi:unnamed protein product [Urochloa humidicola]